MTGYLIAWAFERYAPKDSPLYAVRAEAKAVHRGLWQDVKPCHRGSGGDEPVSEGLLVERVIGVDSPRSVNGRHGK